MTGLEAVPGMGTSIVKKLHTSFITTAEILAVQHPLELNERTSIDEGTAKKIISMLNKTHRAASVTDVIFLYTNQAISKLGMRRFTHEAGRRRIVLKDNAGLPNFEVKMSIVWGKFYDDAHAFKQQEPEVFS